MKLPMRGSTHEIALTEMRCCQGGLCGLLKNVLQTDAKELDLADDFMDEKRREKKGHGLYQEAMTIVLLAAA